jgi:rhamnogalacturonan hydrolase
LVENIYCNWSAGCAVGSLGTDTSKSHFTSNNIQVLIVTGVSNIEYKNVYTIGSDQMIFFKSNGGSGTVSGLSYSNFLGHKNAYGIYIDSDWADETLASGDGVLYTDITFSGFYGDVDTGIQRPPIYFNCPAEVPCTDLTVEDVAIWTDEGDYILYECINAFGDGYCLVDSDDTYDYSTVTTVTATP